MGLVHFVEKGWDWCTLWRRDGTDTLCGDGMGLVHFVETGWDWCTLWSRDGTDVLPDVTAVLRGDRM